MAYEENNKVRYENFTLVNLFFVIAMFRNGCGNNVSAVKRNIQMRSFAIK